MPCNDGRGPADHAHQHNATVLLCGILNMNMANPFIPSPVWTPELRLWWENHRARDAHGYMTKEEPTIWRENKNMPPECF